MELLSAKHMAHEMLAAGVRKRKRFADADVPTVKAVSRPTRIGKMGDFGRRTARHEFVGESIRPRQAGVTA